MESRRTCARTREARLRHQIDALQGQLADREVYLKLTDDVEDFDPDCTPRPAPPPSGNANGSCDYSSKTSSSARQDHYSDTP